MRVGELGVCWGTEKNPTATDSHLSTTVTTEPFNCTLTDLLPETQYHIRAYAIGGTEYYYGEDLTFTTLEGRVVPTLPEGLLSGVFSVGPDTKVRFSLGNLQYQASTNTWRFAESQFAYCATANGNIAENSSEWIDLFGWGTSGYNHGAVCYQPWSTSMDNDDYYAYGQYNKCLYDGDGQADWGYNAISNGGNQTGLWRTPKSDEWDYMINYRETPSGLRFAVACVDGVNGVIVFPDDWDSASYEINEPNRFETGVYTVNAISDADWSTVFEAAGALFLPAAGMREGSDYTCEMQIGSYWASTNYNNYAHDFIFMPEEGGDANGANDRNLGLSVRLVQDMVE